MLVGVSNATDIWFVGFFFVRTHPQQASFWLRRFPVWPSTRQMCCLELCCPVLMDTPFPWKCSVHRQLHELGSMTVSWKHTDREWWQTLHWAHLLRTRQTQPVLRRKTEPCQGSGSISHWLSDLPQEQPWQDFTCHASLCFLPHPSLSLFGNVMDHLESRVWALEVHCPGHCACFNSCVLMWKIILSQTTKSLVLGAHHVSYPQANLKITALLGRCLLDFNESIPAWSHKELKWRQKVEKDCPYLLISRDEKWLERSKRNDSGMVWCSGGLLLINRQLCPWELTWFRSAWNDQTRLAELLSLWAPNTSLRLI